MKTHTITPYLITLLFSIRVMTPAQDTDTTDVDRILAEQLNTTEEVLPVESIPEENATATNEAEDSTSLPAVTLEDAENVDGVTISGAENINEGLVSISYTDVSLADLVRIFAQASGANIIIPEGLNQLASGNLNDVFWRDALEVILKDKGYVLVERQSGIYTITPEAELEAEPLKTEILAFEYITAEDAQPAVQAMLISSNATAHALKDNFLVVKESTSQLAIIKDMVKKIDRARRQVFIEAKFVELKDKSQTDLGIDWQFLEGYRVEASGISREYTRTDTTTTLDSEGSAQWRLNRDNRNNAFSVPGTTRVQDYDGWYNDFRPDDNSLNTIGNGNSTGFRGTGTGLVQGRNISDVAIDQEENIVTLTSIPNMTETIVKKAMLKPADFALTLSALQQLNGTRIVSNPKILVANGENASIKIGTDNPNIRAQTVETEFSTRTVYTLDETTPYINDGISVDVTPFISTDKNITVRIIPELNRILETIVTNDGSTFPVVETRRIQTEFAVNSGMTVAIGGLTTTRDSEVVKKVPLLGDIPIIGKYLFTHTSTSEEQDEIIIFITVQAVNDTIDLNDRDGIPEDGKLIHNWLNLRKAAEAKAKADQEALEE